MKNQPTLTPDRPKQLHRLEDILNGFTWTIFKALSIMLKVVCVPLICIGVAAGIAGLIPALVGLVIFKLSSRSNVFADRVIGSEAANDDAGSDSPKKSSIIKTMQDYISSKLEEGKEGEPS